MSDVQPMIFIGGVGRSGSMLLERLLGELPGVAPLGQVADLWRRGVQAGRRCGCGQAFEHCPFWRRVGSRAFGQWRDSQASWLLRLRARVDRTRRIPAYALGLVSREAELVEYVRSYLRIYTAAAEVADAHTVVDSSRHASLAYCLATTMDLRVVHLVRDPRAVAASRARAKAVSRGDGAGARWAPARTALHWLAQNLAFELLRVKGVRVIRVRYEDLLERPVETVRALATRLGLPYSAEALTAIGDRRVRLGVTHTVSGNRFTGGWVELRDRTASLPLGRRWLVTALTLPLFLWYGYGFRPLRLARRLAHRCTGRLRLRPSP